MGDDLASQTVTLLSVKAFGNVQIVELQNAMLL